MSVVNGLILSALNKFVNGFANDVNQTVVDLSVDSTEISAVPAVLVGVYVNTALSAHALPIEDSATPIITIPASTGVGAYDMGNAGAGIRFETSLVVNPNDVATGNITVFWKPIA